MNISNYISSRPINMNDKPTGFKMNSNPCLDLIDNNPIQLEGKIDNLYIDKRYNQNIDLSNLECKHLDFYYQEGDLSNYILPKNLEILTFMFCKNITLPDLNDNLDTLSIAGCNVQNPNKIPKSLKYLLCHGNNIDDKILDNLPLCKIIGK